MNISLTIAGILCVSILGTLLHFTYRWSGRNPLIGLIAPVNESVWEHMKLLFFSHAPVWTVELKGSDRCLPHICISRRTAHGDAPDTGTVLRLYNRAGT